MEDKVNKRHKRCAPERDTQDALRAGTRTERKNAHGAQQCRVSTGGKWCEGAEPHERERGGSM